MESMFNYLLEYGSLGIFAAFLVWQHLSMQKRFDHLVDKFQGQIEAMRSQSEEKEDKIRDRFDAVVAKYDSERESLQSERTQLRSNLAGMMRDLVKQADGNEDKLESLLTSVEQLQQTTKELANEHRLLVLTRQHSGKGK